MSSATKIVLLILTLTMCVGFGMGLIDPALFMGSVTTVFGFYFGSSKGNKDDVNTPNV
jgi:hypothetical protein